jgi:hypothetical protein
MHDPACLPRRFRLPRPALIGATCLALAACTDEVPKSVAPGLTLLPEPVATAAPLPGRDNVLRRVHFRDRHGEGLLVLERRDETREDADSGDVLDVAVLTAQLHARSDPRGAWSKQWQRQIRQPCAGLDLEAGWFLEHVGVTDLDGDGQAEITLASHTFCGGGIDPHQLHISLIDGGTRYGIEGETRVSLPGEAPFGGERHGSANLATAPAPFVQHLEALWSTLRDQPITM